MWKIATFSAALVLGVLPYQRSLSADVLYRKSAPISIGTGKTEENKIIEWTSCTNPKKQKYAKPPFWITKGDNCSLKAEQFGLKKDGGRYVANNIDKASRIFPDIKTGDVVGYQDDSTNG